MIGKLVSQVAAASGTKRDILAAIALELTPQAAANKLIQQTISYGGPDNISIINVRRSG